jgi:hypothetical protein
MDPERPIEKVLREYARKRGEEFGAGPKLHPAARRSLQEAVVRRFQRTASAPPAWFGIFAGFWPKLGLSLSVCAVLAVVALILLPGVTSRTQKKELAATSDSLPPAIHESRMLQNKEPLQLNQPAPSLVVTANTTVQAQLDREQARSAPVLLQAEVAKDALAAQSPPAAAIPTAPAAAIQNENLIAKQESKVATLENAIAAQPPTDGRIALSRYGLARSLAASAATSGAPAPAPRFMQVSAQTELTRTVKRSRSDKAVLNSFQVVQNGPELQIVDGDGSIYTGSIQAPEQAFGQFDAKPGVVSSLRVSEQVPASRVSVPSEALKQQQLPNYFFRVDGTNRTLNQRVVFMGNVLGASNADLTIQNSNWIVGPAGALGAGTLQNAPANNYVPWPASRVSGKLKIGNAKEVEINAIPAKP